MIDVTKKNIIVSFVIFIIFIAFTLILSFHHENWRDEVQAYLLCRDMSFFELLKNLHYEGHPFFYYLIIYPFIKLGAGMKVVNIFSLLFVYMASWLLLFKTDIKIYNKAFILFSFPFFYEYTIIGRSYSLIILLIFIIGILYKDRKSNAIFIGVLCGLLLNTHLLVSGFVLSIFLFFYLYELLFNRNNNSLEENKKIFIGFIIICLFGILLVFQFIPIVFNGISMSTSREFSLLSIIENFYLILICFGDTKSLPLFIMLLLLIVYFVMIFKESKIVFVSLIFNIIYYAIFHAYIFEDVQAHIINLLLIFLFYYSIINCNKSNFILFLIFLFTFGNSVDMYTFDYKYNFSLAGDTYEFISKNIDSSDLIVTVDDAVTETILGYDSNYKFYDLKSNRYFTYVIWDEKRENTNIDYSYLDENITNGRKTYFILAYNDDICKFNSYVLKQISDKYQVNEVYNNIDKITALGEKYVLYEIIKKT